MNSKLALIVSVVIILTQCGPHRPTSIIIPSLEYANKLRAAAGSSVAADASVAPEVQLASQETLQAGRARLSYVANEGGAEAVPSGMPALKDGVPRPPPLDPSSAGNQGNDPQFFVYQSSSPNVRDYNGPLSLGDPGLSASLWRESRGEPNLFHDQRAWQPMDLLTITVSETSEGKKEANTEVKEKSSAAFSIDKFFGFEEKAAKNQANLDPTALIQAAAQNDFKGEGSTDRKDSLKAKISAMVVEVLPSGILRIEGEKIIAVNGEEQTMVISGLVRTRDINSENEIDSSKIANMRIDNFGKGIVAESQDGGWASRLLRKVWPF